MKVKVTRRTIQLPFLPYYGMLEGNIGYINFNSFTDVYKRQALLCLTVAS